MTRDSPNGIDITVHIGIGACGDWLSHGFVEYAWQSGNALGEAIAAEAVGTRKISARS